VKQQFRAVGVVGESEDVCLKMRRGLDFANPLLELFQRVPGVVAAAVGLSRGCA
jgi:hypothetical protein